MMNITFACDCCLKGVERDSIYAVKTASGWVILDESNRDEALLNATWHVCSSACMQDEQKEEVSRVQ